MPLSNVDERESLLIFADDPKTIRRLEEFLRTTQKWEVDELIEHFRVVADTPESRHLIGGHGTDAERLAAARSALINHAIDDWVEYRMPAPRRITATELLGGFEEAKKLMKELESKKEES